RTLLMDRDVNASTDGGREDDGGRGEIPYPRFISSVAGSFRPGTGPFRKATLRMPVPAYYCGGCWPCAGAGWAGAFCWAGAGAASAGAACCWAGAWEVSVAGLGASWV